MQHTCPAWVMIWVNQLGIWSLAYGSINHSAVQQLHANSYTAEQGKGVAWEAVASPRQKLG